MRVGDMNAKEHKCYVQGLNEGFSGRTGTGGLTLFGYPVEDILELIMQEEERKNPKDFYEEWSKAHARAA